MAQASLYSAVRSQSTCSARWLFDGVAPQQRRPSLGSIKSRPPSTSCLMRLSNSCAQANPGAHNCRSRAMRKGASADLDETERPSDCFGHRIRKRVKAGDEAEEERVQGHAEHDTTCAQSNPGDPAAAQPAGLLPVADDEAPRRGAYRSTYLPIARGVGWAWRADDTRTEVLFGRDSRLSLWAEAHPVRCVRAARSCRVVDRRPHLDRGSWPSCDGGAALVDIVFAAVFALITRATPQPSIGCSPRATRSRR